MTREDAHAVSEILAHRGWAVAQEILDGMIQDDRESVFDLMASRPDSLTGKSAIRHAARAKALMEFKEALLEAPKILLPTERRGK